MGKNHRHKKNLKADKAKVKLKQSKTKFLPKGLNETKATFKIKPIVLAEQLKEKSNDIPLSKRKLNIKDLCSRLKHYNENVRSTACEELVEMFKYFSEEIIRDNLAEIILNVSNLMQDRERKVRNNAAKVITIILEITPKEKLEPFFNYFSTNMRCAMTNIDHNIQEDSLKFLDCFLVNDCDLISKTSDKLLPDFFTLISRLRVENNLSRTVTVNLGSKMTSVTWRIKVLSRLHAVLELILLNKNDKNEEKDVNHCATTCNSFPIYKRSFYQALDNPSWYIDKGDGIDKNTLDNHLVGLIPVLYEIWIEVVPHNKVQKLTHDSTSLSNEASAILSSVVNTMYLLWKYLENGDDDNLKNIFISTEANKFLNHLIANFPYTRSENLNMKNSKVNALSLNLNPDPNCVKENIVICYIYFILNATFTRNTAKTEMKCIANYLNKCLLTKSYVDQNSINHLIEFIKLSMVEKCLVWKKADVNAIQILENLLIFYNSGAIKEKNKINMFKVLAELVDNPYLIKSSHYQSWLSSLSELLCTSYIKDITIEILLKLARMNCSTFLSAVRKNMSKILNNIFSVTVIITQKSFKDENALKREMAYIFYYIKELSCAETNELLQNLSKHLPEEDCNLIKEQVHKCENSCSNV